MGKLDEVREDAKRAVLGVNSDFEKEIDPRLVNWAKSEWSGVIAVCFGVGLLAVGYVIGKFF